MSRIARRARWFVAAALLVASPARAEETPAPAADAAKDAMMAAMAEYGTPGEPHKALEAFVGDWTYTAEYRMGPDEPAQPMAGTASFSLIFDGRFLLQEVQGEAGEEHPPFEGIGYTGYDNLRQAYQSVWFDNMGTGFMSSSGEWDAASASLKEQGAFSCPLTQETHRRYRSVWQVVDGDHLLYETYMYAPDGQEYQAMVIRYARAGTSPALTPLPCPPDADRC
jgi:hypothetical protein